jgi:hypothetical protein
MVVRRIGWERGIGLDSSCEKAQCLPSAHWTDHLRPEGGGYSSDM